MIKILDKGLGNHEQAHLPTYHKETEKQMSQSTNDNPTNANAGQVKTVNETVTLFSPCYCNFNEPSILENLAKVLKHNEISFEFLEREHCCGMPKLELGDLKSVSRLKDLNIPILYEAVRRGSKIIAPVPSCVLMFKQELPLMFPEDEQVLAVANSFNDPFEFLYALHKGTKLNTSFKNSLGTVSYHVACHQRVQNI